MEMEGRQDEGIEFMSKTEENWKVEYYLFDSWFFRMKAMLYLFLCVFIFRINVWMLPHWFCENIS